MPRMRRHTTSRHRMTRILHHILSTLSLLLFILVLLFYVATGPTPRVIWWKHSTSLPYYHLTTIRNSHLELALYRETVLDPWSVQSLTQELQVEQQKLKEQVEIHHELVAHIDTSVTSN